ncbi:DUF4309 domain-containing protein [Sporosarcina cascadiensis]|uniref:DUF4309 domain-containing protein n=1 Tax=Sporosarcina cascadiensis TaxID=2660747 RepID=UPI00129BD29C|nr:DUF4309 domain-containing protein [Sporosarcina cascadiensis]
MNKIKLAGSFIILSSLFAGCAQSTDTSQETVNSQSPTTNETPDKTVSKPEQKTGTEKPAADSEDKENIADQSSESSAEDEQQQMAINMLKELTNDAKKGIVYRQGTQWIIGKTTREEIHQEIGEPEEMKGDFEHYHGSMGSPSIAFKFDGNEVLEEARYFGTNIERQTNLGGITEIILYQELGDPADTHLIEATGETNIMYQPGHYELQFIIGKDGTADHVNLKKRDS